MKVHALRHIRNMGQGWTLPHLFYCNDDNKYVVKLMNNRQGPGVLANELIAFRLAQLLDLPAAECKIVEISKRLVEMYPALMMLNVPAGPHIGSLFAEQGMTLDDEIDLSTCRNRKEMAGMIVFDHWINNWDRHLTESNLLFLSDKSELLLIDHSNAFCGPDWNKEEMEDNTKCVSVFWGYLYEMLAPYIDGPDPFEGYLTSLEGIHRREINKAISGIPKQWGISSEGLETLVEFLDCRKKLVRNAILQLQNNFPIWKRALKNKK